MDATGGSTSKRARKKVATNNGEFVAKRRISHGRFLYQPDLYLRRPIYQLKMYVLIDWRHAVSQAMHHGPVLGFFSLICPHKSVVLLCFDMEN